MTEMILETKTLPKSLWHLATTEKMRVNANAGIIVLLPLEPEEISVHRSLSTKERLKNYNGDFKATEWDTGEPVGQEVF
ncbi:MAG: hypothetical protein FWB74_04860 [Defluviitaleaceae bacterium]|nr:hypothetical protein [Defluviitaleaceae bacterium]